VTSASLVRGPRRALRCPRLQSFLLTDYQHLEIPTYIMGPPPSKTTRTCVNPSCKHFNVFNPSRTLHKCSRCQSVHFFYTVVCDTHQLQGRHTIATRYICRYNTLRSILDTLGLGMPESTLASAQGALRDLGRGCKAEWRIASASN